MERYDAIIIGAGIGGLICGAFLAQRGYKIVIFEKEMRPGGLCSSFTNEGYTFDVAVDSIGGLKKGELLQKIFAKLGIEKKLNLIQLHPIRRNIFPDLSIDIPPDVGMYKDNLKEVFKEEEKGIDGLFSLMEKIYEQSILAIIGDKRGDVLKLRNWMEKSFQDLLDTYLKNKCLKGVLSSYCASSGLPSSQVSAMVAVNTLMHYVKGGAFRVRGGVQKLIALLVEVIENNSGKVCLGEKVKQILTERNRATGVITEKQRHATSKYVISNMDLKTLINSMVPDGVIAKNRIKHLNELEASSSFVTLYMGTDKDLSQDKLMSSVGYFSSYEADSMLNKKDDIFFGLSIPSILDDLVAPKGKHNIVAYWPLSGHEEVDKNEIADKLIKRLECLIPDFSRHILLQKVADAKTFYRYTGNCNGAAYGWKQNAGFYINLPTLRKLMENFYIVGHWAGFGGGIMPSAISSLRVVEEITKEKIGIC